MRGWGWSTPCSSGTKTDQIRRVRGATIHWLNCLFPGQHLTTQRGLSWASGSSSGKREPGGGSQSPPALWVALQEPVLWSHTMGTAVESAGPHAGNLSVIEKKGGLATTLRAGTQILSGQVPLCSAQVLIPTSSFAHLQNQVRDALWPRNLVGCRPAWFGSAEGFCQPYSLVCPCQTKVLIRSPTHCGGCLLAPSDQKSWWQLLEAVWSHSTWAKRWVGRADRPRSKASGPVWSGNLDCGSAWVKTTNRVLAVLELPLPQCPDRDSNL